MEYSFDINEATQYGLNEAIFLKNLKFWLLKNKANKKHFHDDHTWTYNSVQAYTELFPFWSVKTIRNTIESLLEQGIIIKGNYSANTHDRTNWYALKDESILLNGQIHLPKKETPFAEKGKCITDNNTDNNTYTSNKENSKISENEEFLLKKYTLDSLKFALLQKTPAKYETLKIKHKINLDTVLSNFLAYHENKCYPNFEAIAKHLLMYNFVKSETPIKPTAARTYVAPLQPSKIYKPTILTDEEKEEKRIFLERKKMSELK